MLQRLSLRRIGKSFRSGRKRNRMVLRDISFDLDKGEILGIMGDSGAGKTTLGRIAAGLEKPTAGQVLWDGRLVSGPKAEGPGPLRRAVQVVFQNPEAAFNPFKTAGRSLDDVLRLLKVPRPNRPEEMGRVLDMVGLGTDILGRLPGQMSGGQNQRLVLARALLLEPDFLILDEPSSSLDISARARLLRLLKDLQAEKNMGFLFISHERLVLEFMTGRIGRLENGRLDFDSPFAA